MGVGGGEGGEGRVEQQLDGGWVGGVGGQGG